MSAPAAAFAAVMAVINEITSPVEPEHAAVKGAAPAAGAIESPAAAQQMPTAARIAGTLPT